MFVALELHKKTGLLPGKKRLLRTTVPGGTPFYTIECPAGRRIPWKKICRLAGEGGQLLLLPPGVSLPAGLPLAALNLTSFYHALTEQTVLRFLSLLRPYRRGLRLALLDPDGLWSEKGCALLSCARQARVFTEHPEAYEESYEEVLEQTGASLTLCDEYSALSDCSLVLAPFGVPQNLSLREGTFLLGDTPAHGGLLLRPHGLNLPQGLRELCPHGIEPMDFAGALYEKCGLRGLPGHGHAGFLLEGREISLSDGARYVGTLDRTDGFHYN